MKHSIKTLLLYEDEISLVIHNSLKILLEKLQRELQSMQKTNIENDAHFFNIFLIIFQLPYLSYPDFIFTISKVFYSILTNLSIEAQAKFVRLLSKYNTNLKEYISHVQQYITLHTLRWVDTVDINSDSEELLSNQTGYLMFSFHRNFHIQRFI